MSEFELETAKTRKHADPALQDSSQETGALINKMQTAGVAFAGHKGSDFQSSIGSPNQSAGAVGGRLYEETYGKQIASVPGYIRSEFSPGQSLVFPSAVERLKGDVQALSFSAHDYLGRTYARINDYIPPLSLQEKALYAASSLPGVPQSQYEPALPGYKFQFPRDEAAHDNYKTEWWYYVGHLKDDGGHNYGYELTFFRHKIFNQNFYSSHLALSDVDNQNFQFRERSCILHPHSAGANAENYYVWNRDWQVKAGNQSHILQAGTPDFSIQLNLDTLAKPVEHGIDGVSQKATGPGFGSHYYSHTLMPTEGTIIDHGNAHHVKGESWMDHEYGSDMMGNDTKGWDWYSVQLENNSQVMLYMLKHNDGTFDENSSGTIVYPDGTTKHLARSDFSIKATGSWHSPNTNADYPSGWEVSIPSQDMQFSINPFIKNSELLTERSTGITYWEGDCGVVAKVGGKQVKGQGFVELTGYAQPFSQLPDALKP